MKILNSEVIIDWLMNENISEIGKKMPNGMLVDISFSMKLLQVHIDHGCGCKITQDNLGEWLFPCNKHKQRSYEYIDEGIIHPRL